MIVQSAWFSGHSRIVNSQTFVFSAFAIEPSLLKKFSIPALWNGGIETGSRLIINTEI